MREVLFAGKIKESGEWVFGSYLAHEESIEWVGDISDDGMTTFGEGAEIDPNTLCEFTGRRDIYGDRIFENFIVQELGGHRSVVKYSEEEAKFVLESKYVVTELGNKQVTVIGNIFDNPDLIDNA